MLDFEKLDLALEAAVGVAPDALLRAAASRWADRFLLARERLSELAETPKLSEAETLERDRLASFFGCAYGDHGFLARAGTLFTLKHRLTALAEALPRLMHEPQALGAVQREAAILAALADFRLSAPRHADDEPLRTRMRELQDNLAALAAFAQAAMQSGRSVQIATSAARIYGAADLVNVASDFRENLHVAGVIGFILGRLGDRAFTHEGKSLLHELCAEHATRIREQLWDIAMEGYASRGAPPTLAELRELDLALEALRAELVHDGRPGGARAEAVAALYTLLALGRAAGALRITDGMLDGAVLLIAEGLAAESKPEFPKPGGAR